MDQLLNISTGRFAGEEFQQFTEQPVVLRQRHGFITFWLWMGIVCSILSAIINGFVAMSFANLGYVGMQLAMEGIDYQDTVNQLSTYSTMMTIAVIVTSILGIWGYAMLLKWKRSGFWMLVIISVIGMLVNILLIQKIQAIYSLLGFIVFPGSTIIVQCCVTTLSILILWTILQLKKNGKSCWSQLK